MVTVSMAGTVQCQAVIGDRCRCELHSCRVDPISEGYFVLDSSTLCQTQV